MSTHPTPVLRPTPTPTEWVVWVLAWAVLFYGLTQGLALEGRALIQVGLTGLLGVLGLAWVLQVTSTCWGWACRVTWVRALITLSLAALLWVPEVFSQQGLALGLLGLVALLGDGLDGYWARTRHEVSAVGARFDMETDAALMAVLSVAVWQMGRVGVWVLMIGGLRYAFVLASRLWSWLAKPLPESMRRKVICVVQVSVLLAVMPPWFSDGQAAGLLAVALALLWYSFAVDTLYLYRNRHQS